MNTTVDFGKKNFGFGLMRLPMLGNEPGVQGEVDIKLLSEMVDYFMEQGFNYFDTAHGYVGTKSETAIREALVKRYPRDSYILTNKLSGGYFNKAEEIIPLCKLQLEACGVEYFDNYLMHAMTVKEYKKYNDIGAFEEAKKLKEAGLIKHIGISFHDKAVLLEQILTEHPEIEMVQIQLNYIDYDDASVESKLVYEVCEKFSKPVMVMEPIKGGALVRLPDNAREILESRNSGSVASYAIRFAASFTNVKMVLSGMGSMEDMRDNLSYMKDFKPLDEDEKNAVFAVADILRHLDTIPCTACRYCIDGCPKKILIPDLFACKNAKMVFGDWNSDFYYGVNTAAGHGKASECIKCGLCEKACPQHLEIRNLLEKVAVTFEK